MSNILKEVCNIFEIQKINTSSYRPQTNSTCERNNKTIAEKLRTCIDANQLNWPDKLPSIAHAMNTSVCTESTQYTPYFLVFGRECRTPIDTVLTEPSKVGPVAKQLKKFYDPQDRPTNNVDVPTDDEMSDDDDDNKEAENAEDDDEIGQTDIQPENEVPPNTDDIRTNDDPDLYLSRTDNRIDTTAKMMKGLSGHGGADFYCMDSFVEAVVQNDPEKIRTGPDETLYSHMLVFAAEKARKENKVVSMSPDGTFT
ncbi:Hypothetical predicted protein [Mytilus galloprovincialis]|uniref:Integrase catalytic domain-containing protein n=1 Tax=Mytilus galloprovincialis TaxID=29158 RepID=A0A8B6EJZ3_MYTGA|nr:Hypothetical predicted protein [Mytilus galloprovincialis]